MPIKSRTEFRILVYLIVSLRLLRPPHPDPILAVLGRDVRNQPAHVQSLTGTVVTSESKEG